MSLHTLSSLISGLLFSVAGILYIRDITNKKVTPNIASFVVWSIVNLSRLISVILKQVWNAVPYLVVSFIIAATIATLSFKSKKFYFKLPDKIGLTGSLIGLIAWYLTKDPAWNIYILSTIGVLAFAPIIIKAHRQPGLETQGPWLINLAASVFLLLSVNSTRLVVWIIPAQQFLSSFLVNAAIYSGNKKSKVKTA